MFTKFQVDWTSTSSKTTLTKNFNLKRDEQMNGQPDEQMDTQTRKHNAHKWGIKIIFWIQFLPEIIRK